MLSRRKNTDRCDEHEIESTGQPGCRRHVVKAREQEGQAQILPGVRCSEKTCQINSKLKHVRKRSERGVKLFQFVLRQQKDDTVFTWIIEAALITMEGVRDLDERWPVKTSVFGGCDAIWAAQQLIKIKRPVICRVKLFAAQARYRASE